MPKVRNSKGVVMRVPKAILEANGFAPNGDGKRELVEVKVTWMTQEGERLEDVFANYYPGDRRAEVYLGRLGHAGGRFRVIGARRYGYADFARDFDAKRPINLTNVRLGTNASAFWMDVDGRRIGLLEPLMNTFGSMVNLKGRLGRNEPVIKFEFDGKSAIARFKEHPMIELMQVLGEELEIRYSQSKDEKHVYRMTLKNG